MRARLAQPRPLRGPLGAALVALPDRDERLPRHAERPRAARAADGPRPRGRAGDRRTCTRCPEVDVDRADARRAPCRRRRPGRVAVARETIRLAFVAALQHLPPRQRAVLILREVLRWQATEVAELLDTSVASVNSALQRARATLEATRHDAATDAASSTTTDRELLARYVEAFERYDIDALTALLHEDATQSMPPFDLWLQRPRRHLHVVVRAGHRLPGLARDPDGAANGSPAFGAVQAGRDGGGYEPWALQVLEISRRRGSASSRSSSTPSAVPALRAAAPVRRARRAARRSRAARRRRHASSNVEHVLGLEPSQVLGSARSRASGSTSSASSRPAGAFVGRASASSSARIVLLFAPLDVARRSRSGSCGGRCG